MTKDEIKQKFEKLVVETYDGDKFYIKPSGDKDAFLNQVLVDLSDKRFIKIRGSLVSTKAIKSVYYENSNTRDITKISGLNLIPDEVKALKEMGVIKTRPDGGSTISISESNKDKVINYLSRGHKQIKKN
jgi:hypothetical protein